MSKRITRIRIDVYLEDGECYIQGERASADDEKTLRNLVQDHIESQWSFARQKRITPKTWFRTDFSKKESE